MRRTQIASRFLIFAGLALALCALAFGVGCRREKARVTASEAVVGAEEKEIAAAFNSRGQAFAGGVPVAFDAGKKGEHEHVVAITFEAPSGSVTTEIERTGSLLSPHDGIRGDAHGGFAFVAWLSEPFYNPKPGPGNPAPGHRFDLFLKVVDLVEGRDLWIGLVHSTKCCIDRLSMKYNPRTGSVLIAYNDFSRPDSRYLMYGRIKLDRGKPVSAALTPKEIILQDRSEKRFPKFLDNGEDIYLYHTSGDRYGFFAYSGKQQIGISRIDLYDEPVDYRILTDPNPILETLVAKGDTLYFRTRVPNPGGPDGMQTKKTRLQDLPGF